MLRKSSKASKSSKSKKRSLSDFSSPDPIKKATKKTKLAKVQVEVVSTDTIVEPVLSGKTDVTTKEYKEAYGDFYAALNAAALMDEEEGSLPDPVQLMNLAIGADLDPSIFTQQSFPVAENVIDWCRSPKFLGFTGELRPKQFEILTRFFGDVCYLCSDTDYVHKVPVDDSMGNVFDRFVLLKHGVCPKCRRNRTEMLNDWINDPRFSLYNQFDENVRITPVPPNEFVGVWGQRSGKSFTIATFAAPYILHRYLSLPNPPRYFERPSNIILEATFVAPILHQATNNLWRPFREIYDSSPWFRDLRQYLLDEGKRIGIPLYHAANTFILFPGKRIYLAQLAASAQTLRGATRIFCTLDELGWFNTTEDGKRRAGVKDGTEVFNSLSNSLTTIRSAAAKRREKLNDYNALDAYMFNISSPTSVADPIMQRASVAEQHPRMYYTHYATWEVNPDEDEQVLREMTAGKPDVFMRDFCAIPPRALSPFFPNAALVRDLELKDEATAQHLFRYSINQDRQDDGPALLRPVMRDAQVDPFTARIMAVDNGEVDNSFALVVARFDPEFDGIVYEEFVEVAPQRGLKVDLAWCYNEFILPLVKSFRFFHVVFDRWNSAPQVMDLRTNYQVGAERYTLKWGDFEEFRNDLNNVKIRLPPVEIDPEDLLRIRGPLRAEYPRAHFQLQLTTVEQFNRKLHKPENGTDDLFRAAVLAHSYVRKYRELYVRNSLGRGRRRHGKTAGVFRGASVAGGGNSAGSYGPTSLGKSARRSGMYYSGKRDRR